MAKFIRMSPRKTRLVADLVRGLDVETALTQLQFMPKAAAGQIFKLLNSCIANAINNFHLKKDNLYIKTITVDGGPVLKRWQPRAFGRATPIRKRSCHIIIILSERKKSKKIIEQPKIELEKPKVVGTLKELQKEKAIEKVAEKEKTAEGKKPGKTELAKNELKKSRGFLKKFFSRKTG